jgi:hypothetical protein
MAICSTRLCDAGEIGMLTGPHHISEAVTLSLTTRLSLGERLQRNGITQVVLPCSSARVGYQGALAADLSRACFRISSDLMLAADLVELRHANKFLGRLETHLRFRKIRLLVIPNFSMEAIWKD